MVAPTSSSTSTSSDMTSQLNNLAPTFQTQITSIMDAESQPLKNVQSQKDQVNVRLGVYTDVNTNLTAMQKAIQALITTQPFYGLNLVAKPTVTPGTAGATVLTATTSDSAASADYDIVVSKIAKAQSRASAPVASPDVALGNSGTIYLGGDGISASIGSFTPSDSVTTATTSVLGTGQRELGTGAYSVQVKIADGVRQFRLVNADGEAVSIRSATGSSYTSAWQAMPNSGYDTGRGLTLNLSTAGTPGSTAINYTAKGIALNVSTTDTLRTITAAINAASQPDGHDLRASIVGNKLVFTAARTGVNHAMLYTDSANLGFTSDLQPAQNAEFTVNGLSVSRASNTNLTDVVDGTTINLASDAEGKSAHLSVSGNSDQAGTAMSTLVSTFNTTFKHLTDKLAITSATTGSTTTYTRGPLTGDSIFSSLRTEMFSRMNQTYANSGSFKRLEDIGLTINSDLTLSFDSAKFSDAIKNHPTDLSAMLDTAMGKFNTMLSSYTGTTGMLQNSMTSMSDQMKTYDNRITDYNKSLDTRKQSLIDTYAAMQLQLADLGNQASFLGLSLTGTSFSVNKAY